MGFFQSKPAPPPPTTVLAARTVFEGELATKREVELLGTLKGSILTEGLCRIRRGSHLEGRVACADLEAEGEVRGEADVVRTARFREGASFEGTLGYRALSITPGARVEGTLKGPKG